ncbi:unnamed protein product, partial [Mesorhabditis spiculigera]
MCFIPHPAEDAELFNACPLPFVPIYQRPLEIARANVMMQPNGIEQNGLVQDPQVAILNQAIALLVARLVQNWEETLGLAQQQPLQADGDQDETDMEDDYGEDDYIDVEN